MSNFTKEKIDKYASDLLIGLTEEERNMIQEEFDSNNIVKAKKRGISCLRRM